MSTLAAIAIAFAIALILGRFATRFHVPRVTAYLLVGVLCGPSLTKPLGLEPLFANTDTLNALLDFTLGLILFSVGGHFRLARLRRTMSKYLTVSAAESLITFGLVTGGVLLAGGGAGIATLLGAIAVATAPAATVFVIREMDSQGPITDMTLLLTGMNNLISVVLFIVIAYVALPAEVAQEPLYWSLGLPLGIGAILGFVASVWDGRIEGDVDGQILGIATVAGAMGLAGYLGVNGLLTALITGMVVVNASTRERRMFSALKLIDYPLYVLFFVLAGARLHLDAIPHMGVIGLVYMAARSLAKVGGTFLGIRLARLGGTGGPWSGVTLVAQAGVAIGLARVLREAWPGVGAQIETAVLAAVVVFETLGPPLIRTALIRSGEVAVMTTLFRRAPVGVFEGTHQVVEHFRRALGIPSWHKLRSPSDVSVSHLMRRNVETVDVSASFDDVLRHLSGSRYDRLLVTDKTGRLAGVIDYAEIRSVVADPLLAPLVKAADMTSKATIALTTEQTVADAIAIFEENANMTFVPVVDPDDPGKLLGIVSQNDVLGTFRKVG